MTILQKSVGTLKRSPSLYGTLILPFYFLRFLFHVVKERSLWQLRYPPGHYGSPLPSSADARAHRELFFNTVPTVEDGVDLNPSTQERMFREVARFFPDFRPPARPNGQYRYGYDNPMFGFTDGFILFGMLRALKPARVIEIGSGYSSALMIDTAEKYLPNCNFTFIDPYSPNLVPLLANSAGKFRIVRERVQDTPMDLFRTIGANDILFIDSSHVVKIGSDLSTILFAILPTLQKGVIVHIHDILYPFEYSEQSVMEGRAWNEIYFVRAFLQYNSAFEVLLFSSYLERNFTSLISEMMPGYAFGSGNSLWLRKVSD